MIDNGYTLKTTNIFTTIATLRRELKDVQRELVYELLARNIELMQDMSFTVGAKFDKSIYESSVDFVRGRIEGVRGGMFSDSEYDLRSSLSFCPKEGEENTYLVLFNCVNAKLIKAFIESRCEPMQFNYNEHMTDDEENVRRGAVWQKVFEAADWNAASIGCTAQLTYQPDLGKMLDDETPKTLKSYYLRPEDRMYGYIQRHIIKQYVSDLIGRSSISEISPIVLTDFFIRAYDYVESPKGQSDIKALENAWKSAFQPISDSIILS